MKVFEEMDINKDGYISKAEMKLGLEKIGYNFVSDEEVTSIHSFFDESKDGRVSYIEMCKQFAEFSNHNAMKNPSHWSFFIFETIRRASISSSRPLNELFGMKSDMNSFRDNIKIPKDLFFASLSRMQIPLT
jgi:Ca2+-binding EF-hand superfamily protein